MQYFIIIAFYLTFFQSICAPIKKNCYKSTNPDDIQCDPVNNSLSEEILLNLINNDSLILSRDAVDDYNIKMFDALLNEDDNSNTDTITIAKVIEEEKTLPTSESFVVQPRERSLSETFEPDDLPTNAPWPVDFSPELPSNIFTISPDSLVETERKFTSDEGITNISMESENKPKSDEDFAMDFLSHRPNKNAEINTSNMKSGINTGESLLDNSNTMTETIVLKHSIDKNMSSIENSINLSGPRNNLNVENMDLSGVDETYSTDNGKETDVVVITETMIETEKGFEEDVDELNKTDIDEKAKEINSLREDLEDLVNSNRSGIINMTILKESLLKLKEKLNISTININETFKSKLFDLTNHVLNGSNLLLDASTNRTYFIPTILSRLLSSTDSEFSTDISTQGTSTPATINYENALKNCPHQFFRQVYSKLLKKHFKEKLPIPLCGDLYAYYLLNRPMNNLRI